MLMNRVGIDTNVLIYAIDKESDFYRAALKTLASLSGFGTVCWQNLTEFYAVITDKKRVTHPLTSQKAIKEMDSLLNKYSLAIIGPNIKTKEIWFDILKTRKIKGQSVHDTFLSATLISNGINMLITENPKDFSGITDLKTETLNLI